MNKPQYTKDGIGYFGGPPIGIDIKLNGIKLSRQEIAKILFQFHRQIWDKKEELEQDWKDLPKTRDYTYPYTVCKDEYLRMADGVKKKILTTTQNTTKSATKC